MFVQKIVNIATSYRSFENVDI